MADPLKHFMKKGDLEPSIRRAIIDGETGLPYDLTGASVKFIMTKDDLTTIKITAAGVIESPASAGILRYDWTGTDTDTALKFKAEFQITLASGKKLTFPAGDESPGKSYIDVLITADLGD
jgi:hypothetical protein